MAAPARIEHSHTFGKHRVTPQERDRRMRTTFNRLAPHYDRLCDVMTFGLHRYWRRVLARRIRTVEGIRCLDVAGGSGEVGASIAAPGRQVIVLDFSLPMLKIGKARTVPGIQWVAGSAQALPFPQESMDIVTIGFGLRNVTYVHASLQEVLRVLRPGGRFFCLEVSQPWVPLQPFHHAYCRLLVPRLGAHVTDARHAFDYLVESVCGFPGHDDIRDLMRDIGFIDIKVRKLSLGIACIHSATKPQTGGQPPVG